LQQDQAAYTAILQLDTLLDFAITPAPSGYSLEVTSDQRIIKQFSAALAQDARWGRQAIAQWGGLQWSVRLTPTPDTLGLMTSRLPRTVLLAGMLLGRIGGTGAASGLYLEANVPMRQNWSVPGLRREVDARLATERALGKISRRDRTDSVEHHRRFCVLDRNLAFTYANDRAGRLLGDEPDHLTGHSVSSTSGRNWAWMAVRFCSAKPLDRPNHNVV
jgi:PAS domain-containing protein